MDSNYAFNEAIKSMLQNHLSIQGEWFGDGKSAFGIYINLCWDMCPFSATTINFVNE